MSADEASDERELALLSLLRLRLSCEAGIDPVGLGAREVLEEVERESPPEPPP